jgi:hypothetical protein
MNMEEEMKGVRNSKMSFFMPTTINPVLTGSGHGSFLLPSSPHNANAAAMYRESSKK